MNSYCGGVVLFVLFWWFSQHFLSLRVTSGLFLLADGRFRFLAEFVRAPDPQIGYLAFG